MKRRVFGRIVPVVESVCRLSHDAFSICTHWLKAALLLVVIAFSSIVIAQEESKFLGIGIRAFQIGDYVGAITAWEQAAEEGNIVAMYNLGRIYSDKNLNQLDYERSIYWYEKSAKAGHVGSQYNLGRVYIENNPEVQNVAKAIEYWEMASGNGDIGSMQALASLYLIRDVPWHSEKKAVEYLDMAARAGDKASEDVLRQLASQIAKKQQQKPTKDVSPPSKDEKLATERVVAPLEKEDVKKHIESISDIGVEKERVVKEENSKPGTVKANTVALNSQVEPKSMDSDNSPRQVSNTAIGNKPQKASRLDTVKKPPYTMVIEFINTLGDTNGRVKINKVEQHDLIESAHAYAQGGDLSSAVQTLASLAMDGVQESFLPLARYRYQLDNFLDAQSIYYLSMAAQSGNAKAQLFLGEYLTQSHSTIEQSRGWYWINRAYTSNDQSTYIQN